MTTTPLRVEAYRQVDRASPDTGNDSTVLPDGRRQPMGRATSEPVIERCELTLTEAQAAALASGPLEPLPSFGPFGSKPTLTQFFDATGPARAALFPASLAGLLRHPLEARRGFNTHVEPAAEVSSLVVVWRGETEWYLDEAFYRVTSLDLTALPTARCVEVAKGTLQAFRRHSPLVTARRLEGLQALQHPEAKVDLDTPVLELQRTPGMPNSTWWTFRAFADGRIERSVRSMRPTPARAEQTAAPVELSGLFLEAAALHETPTRAAPAPRSDGQDTILTIRMGATRRFTLRSSPPPVVEFATRLMRAFDLP
ncbi:MAG: hypothetical protein SFW67_08620 [Myxococcaceae bacterium]|nr:hypothetical protein [Myxococcaceae bacterium]